MSKIDTKPLEKLRKDAKDSRKKVYDLVTLVTHGDEGRDMLMDAVGAYVKSAGEQAAYEATHKGVVKKLDMPKKGKSDYSQFFYNGMIRDMLNPWD